MPTEKKKIEKSQKYNMVIFWIIKIFCIILESYPFICDNTIITEGKMKMSAIRNRYTMLIMSLLLSNMYLAKLLNY